MYRDDSTLEEEAYDPVHIDAVITDMEAGFREYFEDFAPNHRALAERYEAAISKFQGEQSHYQTLFALDKLEFYRYDPNSFKGDMRRLCPIVRRCLNSPAKVMDSYRASFNGTAGADMLDITTNIVKFGRDFVQEFDEGRHLHAKDPAELGVSELDSEPYTAYGIIGGGIRSHFLYQLHPNVFCNRGQNAIWACYFLVCCKDYGFPGGSEFLMIDPSGAGTQQNYFYPYELFSFYAIQLLKQLESASNALGCKLDSGLRYVYLNHFLDFIADNRREDINCLKPQNDELYY